jgi:hypothetical protein
MRHTEFLEWPATLSEQVGRPTKRHAGQQRRNHAPTRPRDPQPGALSLGSYPDQVADAGPSMQARTGRRIARTKCEVRGSAQMEAIKRQFLRYGSETKSRAAFGKRVLVSVSYWCVPRNR